MAKKRMKKKPNAKATKKTKTKKKTTRKKATRKATKRKTAKKRAAKTKVSKKKVAKKKPAKKTKKKTSKKKTAKKKTRAKADKNRLTLRKSGEDGCWPTPDPWPPGKRHAVRIHNATDYSQELGEIRVGCLLDKNGEYVTSVTVEAGRTWKGKAGSIGSTYTYDDGKGVEPRHGTIDPS